MKRIKVQFAGVETAKPFEGNLTIYYIPDQNQYLRAGVKHQIVIEGFKFAHKDTAKK